MADSALRQFGGSAPLFFLSCLRHGAAPLARSCGGTAHARASPVQLRLADSGGNTCPASERRDASRASLAGRLVRGNCLALARWLRVEAGFAGGRGIGATRWLRSVWSLLAHRSAARQAVAVFGRAPRGGRQLSGSRRAIPFCLTRPGYAHWRNNSAARYARSDSIFSTALAVEPPHQTADF